jgi:hypothetical protein
METNNSAFQEDATKYLKGITSFVPFSEALDSEIFHGDRVESLLVSDSEHSSMVSQCESPLLDGDLTLAFSAFSSEQTEIGDSSEDSSNLKGYDAFITRDYERSSSIIFEPTPIADAGVQVVGATPILPRLLTTYCADFISVLKNIPEQEPRPERSLSNASSYRGGDQSAVKVGGHRTPLFPCLPQNQVDDSSSREEWKTSQLTSEIMRIHPYQNEKWKQRYQDLLDYRKHNGNCNVPFHYKEKPFLSQWVKRQRYQYKCKLQGKHSHLTTERVQVLDMIGFIWDSHSAAWEENFDLLKQFEKKHKHCHVPVANCQLSTWMKRQRRQYKRFMAKQTSTMTQGRMGRLIELDFVWNGSAK